MTSARATRIAAGLGFLAVALGAFGAHGLKPLLASNGTVEMWEKAVFYHFIHTVMLYVLAQKQPVAKWAFGFFLAGIGMFSGSLYVLALAKVHWLVFVTPFGGVSLLAGWVALWRNIKHQAPNAKE
jgi:uncharacterized membrane protein YgdD (TMEM256/DUF423 family)